jgi:hypothetical protein
MMIAGPEVAVPVSLFASIAAIVLGSKWISYKRNAAAGPEALESLERRLARVEVAIDDLAGEIAKIGEGQQFLTKVLADPETARRLGP